MEVIVIDDGVNEEFAHIYTLRHNLEITKSLNIIIRKNYDKTRYSHGSICASIIKKYSPDCEIGSIKILSSNEHNGSCEQLLTALEWCIKTRPSLINMSFGSIEFRDYEPIRVMISKLIQSNCMIVAACNNHNIYSLPACLSGVIGVETKETYRDYQFKYNENYYDFSDVIAASRHLIHGYNDEIILTKLTNSYAAPLMTSKVYEILERKECKKICKIKMELYITSNNSEQIGDVCFSMRPDFIDSAIVINYSDDIIANSLFFRIEGQYNHLDVRTIQLKDKMTNLVIFPPQKSSNHSYMGDIYDLIKRNKEWINGILYCGILPSILKTLCNNEVNCLLWDEEAYLRRFNNYKLPDYTCEIPIISIHGTFDQSIKATVLLNKELVENGYNCMMVSTFKLSYLYSMEYIPTELFESKMFKYFESYFNLDIILFTGCSVESTLIDININIVSEDSECYNIEGDTIIISNELIDRKTKEILTYIIEYFIK